MRLNLHTPEVAALACGVFELLSPVTLKAVRLHPRRARVASLVGLLTGRTLTEHYYRDAGLERLFRDARAAGVMSPTTDQLYDFIGKAVCGMPLF